MKCIFSTWGKIGYYMLENNGVSVIIPTYNRADLLRKSIESVQNQTYEEWEIIIVDDCSTDGTEQVVKEFGDFRIRYIRNEKNLGAGASRNRGGELARYEYIAFQDSDDVWRCGKLEKQMQYMINHSEYDMVYCSFLKHYSNGGSLVVPNNQIGEREGDMYATLLVNNVIGTPTVLIRRNVFLECGGFDTELKAIEDWDLAVRVARNSQIGFVSEILVDAYETQGSISYDGAAYYKARCKMLAQNGVYLQEVGLFDDLVINMFNDAEKRGVLDSVKKIFMLSLKEYYDKEN